jgi:hypothetical protein
MVEANRTIAQIPTIRITTAAHCLAMIRSRNAVKDSLRAYGLKPTHYSAREISSWAQVYLNDHPELIAEAKPVVEVWIAQGVFGKRAQKEFIKQLKIEQSQGERSVANG